MRSMRWLPIVIGCAGCGRIGFESTDSDGPPGGGSSGGGTLVLRDKLDSYTGTTDTHIDQLAPAVDHHLETIMSWGGPDRLALIHYHMLFGASAIPPGATIRSATMRLVLATDCAQPTTIREIAVGWESRVTWDTFGSAPGLQADDMRGPTIVLPAAVAGPATIDVTGSVAGWSLDPTRNEGWVLSSPQAGCGALSTDSADMTQYPELTIVFAP